MNYVKFIICSATLFFAFKGVGQIDSTNLYEAPLTFPIIIHYQNNSAEISHVNRFRLFVLSEYLIENPSYKIKIEGHVCCGPDIRISRKRAKTVYKSLKRLGVPKNQMSYVGKSNTEMIIPKEKSEEDKDKNRRVEIKIIYPK